MRNLRILSVVLKLAAGAALVLCLLCGVMFYQFYLKWIFLFENGRYFDSEAVMVYHESSSVIGVIALVFLLAAAVLWYAGRKVKTKLLG